MLIATAATTASAASAACAACAAPTLAAAAAFPPTPAAAARGRRHLRGPGDGTTVHLLHELPYLSINVAGDHSFSVGDVTRLMPLTPHCTG